MSDSNRIPIYKSQPVLRGMLTGSVRSYDPKVMDPYFETEDADDDFGFKSLPEYALARIFSVPGGHDDDFESSSYVTHDTGPSVCVTQSSPLSDVRKKRKAPDPPSGLAESRNKYPSSDDIVDFGRKFVAGQKRGGVNWRSGSVRQTSLSPNRTRNKSDLFDELLQKLHSKSQSPSVSPRHHRHKTILDKLRSPRINRKLSKRTRTLSREEEAGFKPVTSSNQSSFDETDGFTEDTVFYGILHQDLQRDVEFEVQRIPEYDKYLNELLQETDPGHPDYDHLSRAAAKVRGMVKEREDELGNMDNQKRMERVQDKFPYDDLQLRDMDLQRRQLASRRKSAPGAVLFKTLGKSKSSNNILTQNSMSKKDMESIMRPLRQHNNFNRQYLMEGNVEFSRGMQTQDRYLFLFSDLLLVAKQKSNTTFKLKHRIRVCELWIAYCIDDIIELPRPADRSFVIGWPTNNVVATYQSLELKETWLNKLKEQIEEGRAKQLPKTLPLDVHHRESDKACQVEVEPTTETLSIVKTCLEQLSIPDNEVKDYQLWVKAGHDDSPYPLCGHELPYAIKQSHIREYSKRTEDNLTAFEIQAVMSQMQNNNRKFEFFLKHNKKSPKKHSLEDNPKSKGKRKSPLISLFRKQKEEKKPQGKLFGHHLANVTTPEILIAKPIKELLTILFREGPYTVGILRKSCNAKMSKDLKARLDEGEDCLSTQLWTSLVIGAVIKDYLRSIPQSLLMEDLYDDWCIANDLKDQVEKNNKLKDTLGKLTPPHYELLRHLICVLYHIDKKSEENKMTAYNLSVCIAPSLLWPKNDPNPLATPPALIQYMIENCPQVFGEECIHLFGEIVEQKIRQDSSTDSDSMHSVLSTQSNFRRDDSSIDSLDREMLYTGDIDASPHIMKSHHFSPSNLSGDSGLTLSDSQLYDEDGNGNDIINERLNNYTRSNSQYTPRDVQRLDSDTSRSLDNQYFYSYDPKNPVPPPRRTRRKGSDPSQSPNMEYDRKATRFTSQMNVIVPVRYDKRFNHVNNENNKFKRQSTESLKSVEESSEADSEINMKGYGEGDIGTLIKSASGAHLYFEEINNRTLFEFDNLNTVGKRRNFYKQVSDGAMPLSPQSKYSLSSSRDSVLSDSSGSFLNRQNSPDPLSSSAETPDQEDKGMSQWLSQQSKHTAFMQQARMSQDDSEVGLKLDKKPVNKVDYLVSPKTSPKIKRREPIPVSLRRSFPFQTEMSQKVSGSNISKEAEDIIKSPKLRVTYCSQDSLVDPACETPRKDKLLTPQLDIYNNNSQMAMKQLNIYSTGLQGTSPPPRVVLQGLSNQPTTPRRDNTPLKGNHNILSQERRSSFDMGEFRQRKLQYPMQESSVSSEDEAQDSESEPEFESFRVTTMMNLPLQYDIPKKVITEDKKSKSSESLSRSSSNSDDSGCASRPENPPNYEEAMQRNYLLKSGVSPKEVADMDSETLRQREASMRAKQLYEQSMKQYQERERLPLPSKQFEKKLDSLGEWHEEHSTEEEEVESTTDEDEPASNPRKLYEESLRRYMEEQSTQSRSPLVKTVSRDDNNVSLSKTKGGQGQEQVPNKHLLGVSSLHRSSSDVADLKNYRSPASSNGSSRTSSRDSTPTKRPNQPPPYNDPPPYRSEQTDSSPSSADRHFFRKTGEYFYNPDTQNNSSETRKASAGQANVTNLSAEPAQRSSANAQIVSVPKRRDNILVSNRARNSNSVTPNTPQKDQSNSVKTNNVTTDHTVHSAQSEIGQYRSPVTNTRNRGTSLKVNRTVNSSSPNVLVATQSKQSDLSASVFRTCASSLEPSKPPASPTPPKTSPQGPISYRNPNMSKSSAVLTRSQILPSNFEHFPRRSSLDAAMNGVSAGIKSGSKELPWSVKNLSNIFNQNKTGAVDTKPLQSQSPALSNSSSSSTLSSSSTPSPSSHQRVPPPYTPPPVFERHMIDNMRSSTSSNSSISSSGTARSTPGKQSYNKFGPQARDSFSSTDGSDCSCRYSLNNSHRDSSSIEDLQNNSFTDITYV